MKEIKVTKSIVDDMYEAMLNYLQTRNRTFLDIRIDLAQKLEKESGITWLVWADIAYICAERHVTSLTLYAIIAMLGVEVVDR